MYSDCLDLNRWYHGKSGYIAIIRLTKVLTKEMCEASIKCVITAGINERIILCVINRAKLKRFQKTIPRISQRPLWGLTAMCLNSCHQYLRKPAPFLLLREPR